MTSSRSLAAALLLVALASTACGPGDDTGATDAPPDDLALTVVSSDWNGWDPDHRSTPETTTIDATAGAAATVEGGVRLEVVAVRDGEVDLELDQDLAPRNEGGGSDMNDLVDEVTVTAGEETGLASPTLDAGFSYTLTLGPVGD